MFSERLVTELAGVARCSLDSEQFNSSLCRRVMAGACWNVAVHDQVIGVCQRAQSPVHSTVCGHWAVCGLCLWCLLCHGAQDDRLRWLRRVVAVLLLFHDFFLRLFLRLRPV